MFDHLVNPKATVHGIYVETYVTLGSHVWPLNSTIVFNDKNINRNVLQVTGHFYVSKFNNITTVTSYWD